MCTKIHGVISQNIGIFRHGFIRLLVRSFLGLFDESTKMEKGVNDVHKEIGVEVNTDKTTYVFMSRNENARKKSEYKNWYYFYLCLYNQLFALFHYVFKF